MAEPDIPYMPFTIELGGLATVEGVLRWNPTADTWGLADLQVTWAAPHPLETLPEGLTSLGTMLQLSLRNWGGQPAKFDQGPRGV